jgi:hypothetical protein
MVKKQSTNLIFEHWAVEPALPQFLSAMGKSIVLAPYMDSMVDISSTGWCFRALDTGGGECR